MAGQNARSYGVYSVGLMALHDRDFFDRLLRNPRKTLTDMVSKGDLVLTDADVDDVVQMIQASRPPLTPTQGMAIWDRWHDTGHMDLGDWKTILGDWKL